MTEALPTRKAVRLRGRSFLALVLSPELPFGEWLTQLDDLARRSTGFFLGRPIVLDVAGLPITREQLTDLLAELTKRNVRVMGIEGALPSILSPGMPPEMKGGRNAADIEAPETPEGGPAAKEAKSAAAGAEAPKTPEPVRATHVATTPSLLIDEPVRSGQSIIFPEGDVTVLGSVSSGAEVIAGGSIHVYGALRGRALAGSAGNAHAAEFCRKLEAELIAIDGLYKTAEDIDPKMRGQAVHVWLDDTVLRTVALAN